LNGRRGPVRIDRRSWRRPDQAGPRDFAAPGTILLTADVVRLVGACIEVRPLGRVPIADLLAVLTRAPIGDGAVRCYDSTP
jgi:hypothetical protein